MGKGDQWSVGIVKKLAYIFQFQVYVWWKIEVVFRQGIVWQKCKCDK